MILTTHGCVCACVGPVLDVQLQSLALAKHSLVLDQLQHSLHHKDQTRYLFVPCVYDAILIIRPCINFRDGTSASNSKFQHSHYLAQMPFNDSLMLSLVNVIPVEYSSASASNYLELVSDELRAMSSEECILGFTAVFMISKCYSNFLVCEISQLCFGGVLRSVALGSTDGLST